MEKNPNKFKFCDVGSHSVPSLFHSRKPDRPSCCVNCLRKEPIKKTEIKRTPIVKDVTRQWHDKKPNKPVGETKKRKPINKVSDKQKKINAAYSALRRVYLQLHPTCEVKLQTCSWHATDIHHTYFGSNKRKHYLNDATWKATCRNCHEMMHVMDTETLVKLGLRILD